MKRMNTHAIAVGSALSMAALQNMAAEIPAGLEIKEGDEGGELNKSLTEIKGLIGEQKGIMAKCGDRLDALEKGGDSLDNEALSKMDTRLNEIGEQIEKLQAKGNRPGGGKGEGSQEVDEHKAAFNNFIIKGDENGLAELESKAMSIGSDADGGFAVPEDLDRNIATLLKDESPMRGLATVMPVASETYKRLVNLGGTGSGWVGETDARGGTNTPQLAEVVPPMGEIYANPAATQRALDDVMFDVESFLSNEVIEEFAEQEGVAFISGNGTNKPKGLCAYTTNTTGDAARAFGTMQHFATGVAAALPGTAEATEDLLLNLVYGLKSKYRQSARFLMNSTIVNALRKLRDNDGRTLWQPSMQAGEPATLLGYAVTTDENMADLGAGNLPIAFGDIARTYLILDRVGTRVLRDPFTAKPNVHFYTTKRVGGGVVNSESTKFIKCEA